MYNFESESEKNLNFLTGLSSKCSENTLMEFLNGFNIEVIKFSIGIDFAKKNKTSFRTKAKKINDYKRIEASFDEFIKNYEDRLNQYIIDNKYDKDKFYRTVDEILKTYNLNIPCFDSSYHNQISNIQSTEKIAQTLQRISEKIFNTALKKFIASKNFKSLEQSSSYSQKEKEPEKILSKIRPINSNVFDLSEMIGEENFIS